MWRAIGKSVIGTSHLKGQLPCQDSSGYLRCEHSGEPVLIIAASDGAGSAAFSHLGSQEVVSTLLRHAASSERPPSQISREEVQRWLANSLACLKSVAEREKIEARDLACTVLLAVLGEGHACFAQIGDGAWIAENSGIFGAVTWPQNGEFANETKFITSPDALDSMQFQKCSSPLTAVAGFTDGIQGVALSLASRSVHVPFFEPMFAALADCDDETSLLSPLIGFLSSERVNERTDDDKTLVIARRVTAYQNSNELA
jgi:hypothetical protein